MAWRCSAPSNAGLISNLLSHSLITTPLVASAMTSVDRAHYTPSSGSAYEDSPQQIGFGATISAPHMHAAACENLLLYIEPVEGKERRVLDIGSGSGYLTHVLAQIVGETGRVVGIDHIPGLVELAKRNLKKSESGREYLEGGRVEIVCGDGRKGWPTGGPYDAIHVGAAAREVHGELVGQLKAPGRMFIPVEDESDGGWGGGRGQWIWVVDKDETGTVRRRREMGVRYVPLTDAPKS